LLPLYVSQGGKTVEKRAKQNCTEKRQLSVEPFFQFLAFTAFAQSGHPLGGCLKTFHHRLVCTGFYAYYFHFSFFIGLLR